MVGRWEVIPRQNRIRTTADGHEIEHRLPPKFMQVLMVLARARASTVTREELMDAVWPDTVVGEAVLTRAISELRKALGSEGDADQSIETIPTIGYRLLLPVTAEGEQVKSTFTGSDADEDETEFASGTETSSRALSLAQAWPLGLLATVLIAVWYLTSRGAVAVDDIPREPLRLAPVTSLSGEEFDPSVSPSGDRVAFARIDESETGADVFISPTDGGTAIPFVNSTALESSPTWSPDGRYLAYVSCNPSTGDASIFSKATIGEASPQTVLALDVEHCMAVPQINWSPTQDLIAFSRFIAAENATSIWTVDVTSGALAQRTFPGEDIVDRFPRFAPDGERIAFTRGRSGIDSGVDILVSGPGNAEPFQITSADVDASGFDWTPEGEALIAASQGALWRLDAMYGGKSWLAAPGIDIVQPVVNPSDGSVIFVQSLYDVNIWSIDVQDQSDQGGVLLASTRVDNDPRISPDGNRIAFISDRAGECSVYAADRDGSNEIAVASFNINCFDLRTPRWSPDSRMIAFEAGVDGVWDVFVASTVGGLTRNLTHADSREWSPGWSADSETLYFSSDRNGIKQIWAVSLSGGEPELITATAGSIAQETSDGSSLLYVRPDMPGLWSLPLGGEASQPIQIIEDLSPDDFRSWRLDGEAVTYLRRGERPEIVRFDLASGVSEISLTLPSPLIDCSVADLSPDGTFAVFAQVDRDEDDLVKLEGLQP